MFGRDVPKPFRWKPGLAQKLCERNARARWTLTGANPIQRAEREDRTRTPWFKRHTPLHGVEQGKACAENWRSFASRSQQREQLPRLKEAPASTTAPSVEKIEADGHVERVKDLHNRTFTVRAHFLELFAEDTAPWVRPGFLLKCCRRNARRRGCERAFRVPSSPPARSDTTCCRT